MTYASIHCPCHLKHMLYLRHVVCCRFTPSQLIGTMTPSTLSVRKETVIGRHRCYHHCGQPLSRCVKMSCICLQLAPLGSKATPPRVANDRDSLHRLGARWWT